jgi:hypothetical protein
LLSFVSEICFTKSFPQSVVSFFSHLVILFIEFFNE